MLHYNDNNVIWRFNESPVGVELKQRKNQHFWRTIEPFFLLFRRIVYFLRRDHSYSELIHIIFPDDLFFSFEVKILMIFFSLFHKRKEKKETGKFNHFDATKAYNLNEVYKNKTIAWKMEI